MEYYLSSQMSRIGLLYQELTAKLLTGYLACIPEIQNGD